MYVFFYLYRRKGLLNPDGMLHRLVKKYIDSLNLLPEGAKVVVALSGGADSVALVDILNRLDYACIGAHVNFHLRGDESDRDAAFSHQLCMDLGIPFYKTDLYAAEYAEREGVSVEMAARELRYRWFEQLRKEQGAVAVAVAHHRDDSVETVFAEPDSWHGHPGSDGHQTKKRLCNPSALVLRSGSGIGIPGRTRTHLRNRPFQPAERIPPQ